MPKQVGIIKLKGKLGDLSLYQTKDGYLARLKGGVDKSRIEKDPAFARTRENGREFGHAGSTGKLIRGAFRSLIGRAKDNRVTSRLHKVLMAILQTDDGHPRGARTVEGGDLALLAGFEFNGNAPLSAAVFFPWTVNIDRVAGSVDFDLEAFTPIEALSAPGGTTHFRIMVGSAAVDFAQSSFVGKGAESGWLPWDGQELVAQTLGVAMPAGSNLPLLNVLGVEFGQEVNGEVYLLQNGAYNSLQLITVDTV